MPLPWPTYSCLPFSNGVLDRKPWLRGIRPSASLYFLISRFSYRVRGYFSVVHWCKWKLYFGLFSLTVKTLVLCQCFYFWHHIPVFLLSAQSDIHHARTQRIFLRDWVSKKTPRWRKKAGKKFERRIASSYIFSRLNFTYSTLRFLFRMSKRILFPCFLFPALTSSPYPSQNSVKGASDSVAE